MTSGFSGNGFLCDSLLSRRIWSAFRERRVALRLLRQRFLNHSTSTSRKVQFVNKESFLKMLSFVRSLIFLGLASVSLAAPQFYSQYGTGFGYPAFGNNPSFGGGLSFSPFNGFNNLEYQNYQTSQFGYPSNPYGGFVDTRFGGTYNGFADSQTYPTNAHQGNRFG